MGAVCSGNYYGFSYGFETGGPGSFLLAFLPVTAMYVCFMACYMELAVSSPSAGGASEYARRSMGGFAGFMAGFSVLAYIVAPCAVAITTGQLLHYLVPAIPAMTATVVFFCLFVALNLLGAKSSSQFELIATIAALAGLVLFAAVALPHFRVENLALDPPFRAGLRGIAGAVPFAMWFYFAVDGPIMQSEEMEDPKTGFSGAMFPRWSRCLSRRSLTCCCPQALPITMRSPKWTIRWSALLNWRWAKALLCRRSSLPLRSLPWSRPSPPLSWPSPVRRMPWDGRGICRSCSRG